MLRLLTSGGKNLFYHMKRLFLLVMICFGTVWGCDSPSPEDTLAETSSAKNPAASEYQLDPSARIPEAEAGFLLSLKKAIRANDEKAIKSLYELRGGNPAFADVVPSVISQLSRLSLEGAEVFIEANDKAARYGMKFTVPYFGDVVIKTKGETSTGTMRIPVGIRDGRYYLTLGAGA